jgi:glycerol-3-phosphate acyltransferase PlsY
MILVAYLIGGIPVGLLAGRARGVDLRAVGSGNIGASNALRALGPRVGAVVWIADMLKGLLPTVWAAWVMLHLMNIQDPWPYVAGVGFAAVLGHCFTPYLRFSGGRGVSTALGAILALDWRAGVIAFVIWLFVLGFTHYISLSSLVAIALVPVFMVLLPRDVSHVAQRTPYLIFGIGLAVLVIIRHLPNIGRLLSHTETRIGEKAGAPIAEGIGGGAESETEYR